LAKDFKIRKYNYSFFIALLVVVGSPHSDVGLHPVNSVYALALALFESEVFGFDLKPAF
jgi:hypothetical protein